MFGVLDFILWLTIATYNEASNQPQIHREAIAITIINRVEKEQKHISLVLKERNQYSWINKPKQVITSKDKAQFWMCFRAALSALDRHSSGDRLYGATHFYNPKYASPVWRHDMTFVGKYGDHRLYKEKRKKKKKKR